MDIEKDKTMFKNMIFAIFPLLLPSTGLAVREAVSPSLLDAIRHVESSGNRHAVGDGGKAVGAYQLWPIHVEDANRILKLRKSNQRFTLADRKDESKAREITRIIIEHYSKGMPEDKLAVIHISPTKRFDWDRPAARKYLEKIRKVMK
jgi:hypothetical protein